MTRYGEQILAIVMRKGEHPTAEQIFLEMKANNPKIAQGTVYNIKQPCKRGQDNSYFSVRVPGYV